MSTLAFILHLALDWCLSSWQGLAAQVQRARAVQTDSCQTSPMILGVALRHELTAQFGHRLAEQNQSRVHDGYLRAYIMPGLCRITGTSRLSPRSLTESKRSPHANRPADCHICCLSSGVLHKATHQHQSSAPVCGCPGTRAL